MAEMLKKDRSFDEGVFDPDAEDAYWREHYLSRPYVTPGSPYSDYRDAYRYGWESDSKYRSSWDDASDKLERGWEKAKRESRLAWADAKHAVRDAWHRLERAMPGDADRDGR